MKCINCGTDNKLKDRTDNQDRCKNCGHPFVFEPTSMGNIKITDPMFAKAIADLSANNTLFFTPRQLATQKGMLIQSSETSAQAAKQLPLEISHSLSAEELKWLESGNFVELLPSR